jgi:Lrp/AsnC family leucine-responsive transcriptional regulator
MLDQTDLRIVKMLQLNGRVTQVDVAREIGLAPSAVMERIRKLETRGVIRGYAAIVDPRAVGQALLAFVAVSTAEVAGEDGIGRELADVPEVLEVHHVAGDDCFLVKIRARDAEHLGELLKNSVGRVKGVRSTRTTIVLGTLKESTALPLSTGSADDMEASA